jgi:hypothetical protein
MAQLVHVGSMYTPGLRDVLHVKPVSLQLWFTLGAMALSLFVAIEAAKLARTLLERHGRTGPLPHE